MAYSDWLFYCVIAVGILAGGGKLADELILDHQADTLRLWLLEKSEKIDSIKTTQIPDKLISLLLRFEVLLFGRSLTALWFLKIATLSAAFTFVFTPMLRGYGTYHVTVNFINEEATYFDSVVRVLHFTTDSNLPIIFASNVLLDIASVSVTIFALERYQSAKNQLSKLVIIALDFAACSAFFVLCFFVSARFSAQTPGVDLMPLLLLLYHSLFENGPMFWVVIFGSVAFAITITFPTLLYVSTILLSAIFKLFQSISKRIVMQLIEKGTFGEKSIFFYVGTTLSFISVAGLSIFKALQ